MQLPTLNAGDMSYVRWINNLLSSRGVSLLGGEMSFADYDLAGYLLAQPNLLN